MLAKLFLAWVALTASEGEGKRRKLLSAAAMLSDEPAVRKQVVFATLKRHVEDRKAAREDKVRYAVHRLQTGLLHVCFLAWLEAMPESFGGGSGGAGAGAGASGSEVRALRHEVESLKAQLSEVAKGLAMQERTKAYRYEIALMRDELHSFLFHTIPHDTSWAAPSHARHPQRQAAIVSSHSRSSSDDDDDDDGGGDESGVVQAAARSGRPRSGGPTRSGDALIHRPPQGRLSRPSSARRALKARQRHPLEHDLDALDTALVTPASSPCERPDEARHAERPLDGRPAPTPAYGALRTQGPRPPAHQRPQSASRRGPRTQSLAAASVQMPSGQLHFTCSSLGGGVGGGSMQSSVVPRVAAGIGGAKSTMMAFAQRGHFAMTLPPIN